jgi:carboxymethylenebutenolidase
MKAGPVFAMGTAARVRQLLDHYRLVFEKERQMMTELLSAQTVLIGGTGGDEIQAYLARPGGDGSRGGVVVIHDLFGFDRDTSEIVLRFAELGYDAICPDLFWRYAQGVAPEDASVTARANGGVPDEGLIEDVAAAAGYLRSLPTSNGRVGVIGYGAGGRQAVLAACNVDFDAAVDCYGEYVVGARPEGMFPFQVTNIVDQLPRLRAPLLGLFGKEDNYPSPEQVAELDAILDEENKPHEFHSYDHAGHAFFAVDDPSYRVAAANDGWERITGFYDAHLRG